MNKSEVIRELYQEGKSVSEIAKTLGLSYQRVYNTLRRSGLLPKAQTPNSGTYRRFIEGLEIRSVELREVHAHLERKPEGGLHLEAQMDPFGPEEIPGGFAAGLRLALTFRDAQGAFGSLELRMAALYTSPIFPEEALFQIFRERNLPLNLWPYLRLHVDFLTGQMGLPRLVLPVFKA
jgi:hypothetical protein